VDDAVLALDLVGRLRDELAWRFLAEDIAAAVGRGELVGRVGLAEAELKGRGKSVWRSLRGGWCCRPYLLYVEGHLNLGNVLGDPPLQRPKVDGLAHSSGHGRFDFYSACVGR
jgi:hypothetical protein